MDSTQGKGVKYLVFLDKASTKRLSSNCKDVMEEYSQNIYGNPSSIHGQGQKANELLEDCRNNILKLLNGKGVVIFTSGATESNNMAIQYGVEFSDNIITSSIEHNSIYHFLNKTGKKYSIYNTLLKEWDINHTIDISNNETSFLTHCLVDSECGFYISPSLFEESTLGHKNNSNVLHHVDFTQGIDKHKLDVSTNEIDFVSFSGHKIGGLKGVGCLYISENALKQVPALRKDFDTGNHQEYGLRIGTQNVVGIATLNECVKELLYVDIIKQQEDIKNTVYKYLLYHIDKLGYDYNLNNKGYYHFPNFINISFDGVRGENLLAVLSAKGCSISTGSACMSGSDTKSRVLSSINLTKKEIESSIRITVDGSETKKELDFFITSLGESLELLTKR